MSAHPYREGDPATPPLEPRRIPWHTIGQCILAVGGIALAAVLLSAFVLNVSAAVPFYENALRHLAAACVCVGAIGGAIWACANIRGCR